jgi:hypothetical protein
MIFNVSVLRQFLWRWSNVEGSRTGAELFFNARHCWIGEDIWSFKCQRVWSFISDEIRTLRALQQCEQTREINSACRCPSENRATRFNRGIREIRSFMRSDSSSQQRMHLHESQHLKHFCTKDFGHRRSIHERDCISDNWKRLCHWFRSLHLIPFNRSHILAPWPNNWRKSRNWFARMRMRFERFQSRQSSGIWYRVFGNYLS